MSQDKTTLHPVSLRLRTGLLWYNLVRRHFQHWTTKASCRRQWIKEGRDPAAFDLFCKTPAWLTKDAVQWAMRMRHEMEKRDGK